MGGSKKKRGQAMTMRAITKTRLALGLMGLIAAVGLSAEPSAAAPPAPEVSVPAAAAASAAAAPRPAAALGHVAFANSCDAKVQAQFERAVAMLHSFWYSAGEAAFREVLKDDPHCAIATWGIASILMSNALAGQGASPAGAIAAQAAIDQGRA